MANLLYDFLPGATVTPYIGAGAGIAFVDDNLQGCTLVQHAVRLPGHRWRRLECQPAFRIGLDGRYYGTTNPGELLQQQHHGHAGPELQVRPAGAAAAASAAADGGAAVVHGVLRLGPLEPEPAGAEHDQAGGRRLQDQGQRPHHGDRPHRHVGPGAYNMALSLRRANTVKDALVREGVPAQAISVVGRGEQGRWCRPATACASRRTAASRSSSNRHHGSCRLTWRPSPGPHFGPSAFDRWAFFAGPYSLLGWPRASSPNPRSNATKLRYTMLFRRQPFPSFYGWQVRLR